MCARRSWPKNEKGIKKELMMITINTTRLNDYLQEKQEDLLCNLHTCHHLVQLLFFRFSPEGKEDFANFIPIDLQL